MHYARMPRLGVAAAALGLAGAVAAPAFGQYVNPEDKRSVVTVTVAESPAGVCYQAALAGTEGVERVYDAGALASCNAALESELLDADRTATHVNRAIIQAGLGDLDAALGDLETAVRRNPELQAAQLTLGGLYVRLERWADAEAALTRGIELDPTGAAAADYFARGGAREELGDIPGAYADYSVAAELAPDWDLPRQELVRFQVIRDEADDGGS